MKRNVSNKRASQVLELAGPLAGTLSLAIQEFSNASRKSGMTTTDTSATIMTAVAIVASGVLNVITGPDVSVEKLKEHLFDLIEESSKKGWEQVHGQEKS